MPSRKLRCLTIEHLWKAGDVLYLEARYVSILNGGRSAACGHNFNAQLRQALCRSRQREKRSGVMSRYKLSGQSSLP